MGHNNYPTTRKNRTTEYAQSTQLLKIIGVERFKEIFSRVGMYLAARELEKELNTPVSSSVVRYIRRYKLNSGEVQNEERVVEEAQQS